MPSPNIGRVDEEQVALGVEQGVAGRSTHGDTHQGVQLSLGEHRHEQAERMLGGGVGLALFTLRADLLDILGAASASASVFSAL